MWITDGRRGKKAADQKIVNNNNRKKVRNY